MADIDTTLGIRRAVIEDAVACSAVLCASILELCTADHQGDDQLITRWIENKTPETLRRWIQSPEATIYVVEIDHHIVGVGGVSGSEVALNYVSPDRRGSGVSTAMLKELEKVLFDEGVRVAQLTSTRTARDFYRKAGWLDSGEPVESLGILGYPMRKTLSLNSAFLVGD